MKSQRTFLCAVVFMCFVSRLSSLTQPNEEQTHPSPEPWKNVLEQNEGITDQRSSVLANDELASQQLVETPALTATPALSTTEIWTTGDLTEQEITPTIAPATPKYDLGAAMPVSYSVAHDGGPGGAVEGVAEDVSVMVPDGLKFSVDSSPPVLASNEPVPAPDPEEISETKAQKEESISSVLEQAQEQSKPTEEEMPSFDEFKRQKLREEEEKMKQQSIQDSGGAPPKQKLKKPKKRKQTNYASVDCGAKVLEINSEASSAEAILTENRDIYMLNPCSAKIFFVVELCDTAHVKSIDIANFELFSSMPESFRVSVSSRYPTREWSMLGTFQATDHRDVQSFPLDEAVYAKYLKVEMLSHFGSEHYCPLSLLRAYGISMMEELEDQETDGQDDGDASENDADDDDVPVLPADPRAAQDGAERKPGLLEAAAGTVINLVKKIVGSEAPGGESGANGPQQSIVTLIEPDDGEENSTGLEEPAAARLGPTKPPASPQKDSLAQSPAPSPCEVFVERLRHPSFGCVNGSFIICKKYQNWTVDPAPDAAPVGAAVVKHKSPIVVKLDASDEEEKQGGSRAGSGDKKPAKGSRNKAKEKEREKKKGRKRSSRKIRLAADLAAGQQVKPAAVPGEVGQNVSEQRDGPGGVVEAVGVHASAALAAQPSAPAPHPSVESSGSAQEQSTPSLPEATAVTTEPQPGVSTAATATTAVAEEASVVAQAAGENSEELQDSDHKKPSGVEKELTVRLNSSSSEPEIRSSSASSPQSEAEPSPSAASEASVPSAVHSSDGTGHESVAGLAMSQATAVQSSCTAANSIGLINPGSPHVDVLEIKLTDSGKEGTAELQRPDGHGSPGEDQNAPAGEGGGVAEPAQEKLAPEEEQKPLMKEGDVEKPVDVSAVYPDQTASSAAPGEISSSLEDESPLPPPPVDVDAPLLASVCRQDASASPEVGSELASRAAQQASVSLGLGAGGQKESVFMRLSNRIKALEQNLTLSTQYMEQINQRYRKSLDELTKTFEKKMALLTEANKKADVVMNGQKEEISQLQEQLDKANVFVSELRQKMASINVEVMERHVIGLALEVLFILALMLMFRRCERQRVLLSPPPGASPVKNGVGPPKDQRHSDGTARGRRTDDGRVQPEVQIVRAMSLPVGADDHIKDPLVSVESKKKKHKRRSKCLEPALPPAVASDTSPQAPPSMVTYTAGLLFSSARGMLDSWMVKKPAGCQSEPDIPVASSETNAPKAAVSLVRARSLSGEEEYRKDKAAPPPPPPPPRPQNGWAKRVPTPPPTNFSEGRRNVGCNGTHSPRKPGAQNSLFSFGKYGKQVKVG